jgi:cell division transport system ATP-binding protein
MTAAVSKRVLQAGQIMTVIVQNHQGPDLPGATGPRLCPNPLIPDSEFSIKTQVGANVKRVEDDRVIRFENVGLRYGSGPEILRDVSFHVLPGSFHFLTGPSGAGKTTLLRLLFMSLRPTRGLIFVFGENVTDLAAAGRAELRRRIGIVFQDFRLLDHLTTWENVALPLRVMGKRESDYREDVTDLLRWVGLGDRIHAYPEVLSGGEKQRAAIARAVIGRPELLLADEPTGNVDPVIADRLLRLFVELNRLGTSVIIATHDYGLMDQLDAPRLVIYEGHLEVR